MIWTDIFASGISNSSSLVIQDSKKLPILDVVEAHDLFFVNVRFKEFLKYLIVLYILSGLYLKVAFRYVKMKNGKIENKNSFLGTYFMSHNETFSLPSRCFVLLFLNAEFMIQNRELLEGALKWTYNTFCSKYFWIKNVKSHSHYVRSGW